MRSTRPQPIHSLPSNKKPNNIETFLVVTVQGVDTSSLQQWIKRALMRIMSTLNSCYSIVAIDFFPFSFLCIVLLYGGFSGIN